MNAKLFAINSKDVIKGFIVAALSTFFTAVATVLGSGALPTLVQLKATALVGISSGMAYLVKNFLTNSKDELLKGDK